MEKFIQRLLVNHRYLALSMLCGLLYLSNLGGYRLFDVDEPRYAETSRVMLETGDYVVPYFNGQYRFEKPVLTYWLIAGAYHLFGTGEFGARLPSALAGLGTVLLTCLLATRLLSPGLGLAAGALLACCVQFLALSRTAITDMPLTFFLTCCLVLFYLGHAAEKDRPGRLCYLGSFAASGLAVLTKGPVGLVLPGAIIAVFLWSAKRSRRSLGRIPWVGGTALFAAVCLPWYILVNLRSDFEFYRVFILMHNFQRFFGQVTSDGQHVQPFYYYLPCLLAGAYPWSFFVLQAVLVPLWRKIKKSGRRSPWGPEMFPLVWAAGVILFFSVSRAKLPTYITPAFPPLAILLAAYWSSLVDGKAKGPPIKALLVPSALGAAFSLILAPGLIYKAPELAPFDPGNLPLVTASALALGPAAALWLLVKGRPRGAFSFQVAGQAVLALVLAWSILPLVSEHRQEPQVRLLKQAESHLGQDGILAAYRYRKPALVFYSKRKVLFMEAGQKTALDTLRAPYAVLTRDRYRGELIKAFPELKLLGSEEKLVLFGG